MSQFEFSAHRRSSFIPAVFVAHSFPPPAVQLRLSQGSLSMSGALSDSGQPSHRRCRSSLSVSGHRLEALRANGVATSPSVQAPTASNSSTKRLSHRSGNSWVHTGTPCIYKLRFGRIIGEGSGAASESDHVRWLLAMPSPYCGLDSTHETSLRAYT